MTQEQIQLVKKSWRLFRHVDPLLIGGLFYKKLFTDHPHLRRLFKLNGDDQSLKLIDTLNAIVYHLNESDTACEDLKALALRHLGYGVKPAHYAAVGAALLWTLEQGMGLDWTEEVSQSWQACYNYISRQMIQAC